MNATLNLDGLEVTRLAPASVADAAAIVKEQRAKKEAVYPVGGGTMLDFGLPPAKPGVALDVTKLNHVIDYPARDMTVTVQAGMTFAQLQSLLAAENQWLPLDVPDPETMTLGGLIACNISGPSRYGYGTLRDYLIGITFLDHDGSEIHGGGRVVKNVAGYDLMKLHLGALGSMGVITQVTLKVRPKPETRRGLVIPPGKRLAELLDLLQASASRPVAVTYANEITVAFEDKETTVAWQMKTLTDELAKTGFESAVVPDIDAALRNAAALQLRGGFVAMTAVKPSEWASKRPDQAFGEPLNGILFCSAEAPVELPAGPRWVVRRALREWKTPVRVFGQPTAEFELMRHIQHTLDPDSVFNPGRLFAA